MRILPVAILAGGLATRLGPLTRAMPKSLVDIGGRPFIAYQLDLLKRNGIERVVLCVGHFGEAIRQAVGNGGAFGLRVDYSHDGPALLGTGGALRKAARQLGESFFVLYGDSYLDCDYGRIQRVFEECGKPALMTVFRNRGRWDRSNVVFRDGAVLRYDKNDASGEMEFIDYGLSILTGAVLAQAGGGKPFDLGEVYAGMANRGEMAGCEVSGRFYEIGSPGGLEETRRYLRKRCERE